MREKEREREREVLINKRVEEDNAMGSLECAKCNANANANALPEFESEIL